MKDIIKYISIIASLCVFFSCSLKEDFVLTETLSVEYVARLTGFNNVDVATKSAPTEEFETAVYTAYLLLFDNSTGDRIVFESIDVSSGSLSQTVVGKAPESGLACFIANVSQEFANGLTTIDALNSAVLNITYATYSEAGGYLGVPKLTVNDESKLCIPMFGSVPVTNLTNGVNIEMPVTRLFAKISMNIKMQLTNVLLQQVQSLVKYQNENGMWHTLIDDPTSYVESSATCGFGYGILKAVHTGLIDKAYEATAFKALEPILGYIADTGVVNQVSYGTPMGRESKDFYKNIELRQMPYGQALAMLFLAQCLEA